MRQSAYTRDSFIQRVVSTSALIYHSMLIALLLVRGLASVGATASYLAPLWDLWWLQFAFAFLPYFFVPALLTIPLALYGQKAVGRRLAFLIALPILWTIMLQIAPSPTLSVYPEKSFRLLTYNVLYGNLRFEEDMRWIIAQAPDVIVLQEIDVEFYDPRLDILKRAGWWYEAYIRGSVRILSRTPYRDVSRPSIEPAGDGNVGRPVMRVVVDWDGQDVVIYGVHLSLPFVNQAHPPFAGTLLERLFPPLVLHYEETRRNQQIRTLTQRAQAETTPTLIAGDFNMSAWSPIYDVLAQDFSDAWATAHYRWGTTWALMQAPSVPILRLDYIWVSGDWQVHGVAMSERMGSDHRALFADLSLRD